MEEYTDCQSQIWQIFQKHQTLPEDLQDLHFHFDDFKNSTEKDFKFLKEATSRNVENFQTSLNLQQTYSASLCSHISNIYNKLAELQRQIQNHHTHMNPGDTVQIEAPDFDPDIDGVSSTSMYKRLNKLLTQGTASPAPKITEPENKCSTPATSIQQLATQDTDWPDAIPVQIPSLIDQPEDQGLDRHQTQHNSERIKIPDLEENSQEEQFADLDSYLAHHNTYEASQYIHQEYRSHLHALDDDQYYVEIDRSYYSYKTPAAQSSTWTMQNYRRFDEDIQKRQRTSKERRVAQTQTIWPKNSFPTMPKVHQQSLTFYVIGSIMSMLKHARST